MKRLVTNLATAAALVCVCALAALDVDAQPAPAPQQVPHVNVNTASPEQLAYLPRVGKVIAARIAEYRALHGQFRKVSDLRQVKGIGEKVLATLAPFVTLSGPTTATAKIHDAMPAARVVHS